MRAIIFSALLLLGSFSFGQKSLVCFTFDDLPCVSYGISDTVYQKALIEKLIVSLKKNNIPAIGFVNEMKIYENDKINSFQAGLLKSWIDHDLDLGNHTFSHPDYNLVSFDYYSRDLIRGEKMLKKLLASKGEKLKYFRHPFLHVGNTRQKADSLDHFLNERGYKVAPVTIDNEDYLFALAYSRTKALKNTGLMKQIGHDYVEYMEMKVKYFENQSIKLFDRNISQILLLHASSLNSDYVDSLALMFKRNNYEFVSLDRALEDKAYKTEITVFGKWGISWLDKWAMSMGKKGDFFKNEPVTPDYIKKLAE